MSDEEMIQRMNLHSLLKHHRWMHVSITKTDLGSFDDLLEALVKMGLQTEKRPPSQEKQEDDDGLFRLKSGRIVRNRVGENSYIDPETMEVVHVTAEDEIQKINFEKSRSERQGEGMASLFLGWLKRKDADDAVFLREIETCEHDSWDHYTHLRLAHLLMKNLGRRKAISEIFRLIENFIKHSKRTNGKTFHVTMTYFWCHIIDYAIVQTGERAQDWKTFLLMNPILANGGLFLHYYSKNLMLMSADSRVRVVLPDKNPLPSLLSNVNKPSVLSPSEHHALRNDLLLPADAFLANVRMGTIDSWSHESYLRMVLELLLELGRKEAREAIYQHLKAVEKEHFHLTIAMFWIQMVQLDLARLGVQVTDRVELALRPASISALSAPIHDKSLWKQFYSEKALFKGNAATEFVPPDLKPFPLN